MYSRRLKIVYFASHRRMMEVLFGQGQIKLVQMEHVNILTLLHQQIGINQY
jgi:hypothetical protein